MVKFKSKFEEELWRSICKTQNVKLEYESEILPYSWLSNYYPDFVCSFPDGRKLYIEAKGYFRVRDMVKMKAVKKENPDADIRFVFQGDKKVRKKSKMLYSDWCNKYGFIYSIGSVPREWLA